MAYETVSSVEASDVEGQANNRTTNFAQHHMVASQQLSATAAKLKADAEEEWRRHPEPPMTKPPLWCPEEVDMGNTGSMMHKMQWEDAMEMLVGAGVAETAVHPDVEPFMISEGSNDIPQALWGQDALRVSTSRGAPLPSGSILGVYQGWVGTKYELQSLIWADAARMVESARLTGVVGVVERLRVERQWKSYTTALQSSKCSGWSLTPTLMISAFGRGGRRISNHMSLINDGTSDPMQAIRGHCSLPNREPNASFANVRHRGWTYKVVITTEIINPGDEVLLSYGESFWAPHRTCESEKKLWDMLLREEDKRNGQGWCLPSFMVWLVTLKWLLQQMFLVAFCVPRSEVEADALVATRVQGPGPLDNGVEL